MHKTLLAVTTTCDFSSLSEINDCLKREGRRLATNNEIPALDFQYTTAPDWTRTIRGCVALFVPLVVTDTPDEQSPLGKRIIVELNTITKLNREPVLSTFLPGMAAPFSFESYGGVLPAGTVLWTAPLVAIAA